MVIFDFKGNFHRKFKKKNISNQNFPIYKALICSKYKKHSLTMLYRFFLEYVQLDFPITIQQKKWLSNLFKNM